MANLSRGLTNDLNNASDRVQEFYEATKSREPLQYRGIENLSDGGMVAITWTARPFKDRKAYLDWLENQYHG